MKSKKLLNEIKYTKSLMGLEKNKLILTELRAIAVREKIN